MQEQGKSGVPLRWEVDLQDGEEVDPARQGGGACQMGKGDTCTENGRWTTGRGRVDCKAREGRTARWGENEPARVGMGLHKNGEVELLWEGKWTARWGECSYKDEGKSGPSQNREE
ncbi:hypothetical protein AVEN_27113-1 [Araneus ventricosus]|uniref:Uncharacterized protein n=1 Tax=Araneus ventricosus TaxID=182803 RepID=A0A4Y2DCH8_ARAVE|nr:hypothetical protein AVEN_27113-1 [Araneus ventricosus]